MRFIRDLKIGHKFLLIAALAAFFCTPPTLLLLRSEFRLLAKANAERTGVAPVGALLDTIRLTQVHRGISTNWLGGNEAVQASRVSRAAELDRSMAAMLAATAVYPGGQLAGRRAAVQQQWQTLHDQVATRALDAQTGYQRHTALVAEELRLLADVADRSQLMLDPEASSYYLVAAVVETLPRLSEQMGQSRALGALYLKRGAMTPTEKGSLEAGLTQLSQFAVDNERYLRNAAEADPALFAPLAATRQAAEQSVTAAIALVRTKLLDAAALDTPPLAYFNTLTGYIDDQFRLIDASFATLSRQLDARVSASRTVLSLLLVSGLSALTLASCLVVILSRSTGRTVAAAQAAAEALARGDLDHHVHSDARDEIGRMASTLGQAMQHLAGMVREVKSTGDSVSTASAQIAAANGDLSARTEQTAANLEQAASAMEQLRATVRNNAEAAQQATHLASESSQVAASGGALVGQVVSTMQEISERSGKIADIVGVIDGIAFQTNILALNAAVEAARAGEQGRGFAVVAAEVRSLAARSSMAAREIKSIIGHSVAQIGEGSAQVESAGLKMQEIVGSVQGVSHIIEDIRQAANAQFEGIHRISHAMATMDQATQENAAMVEQSTVGTRGLSDEVGQLRSALQAFKLADNPAMQRPFAAA